ncbi:hypothetical protein HanXRQr2_Chr16g0760311 [Helianthus annuus]|uniref:Uncharacterized protein n=1 Tax=Helianthus annuus TaxID=4232 RepID=A0A9K3H190_HELAN|nr:hypothetical protein HanXRQr2_Chr16g0760311 [Helianthus annuus]
MDGEVSCSLGAVFGELSGLNPRPVENSSKFKRHTGFIPRHFLFIGHLGIVVHQRGWTRLIPYTFHVSFQLLNVYDVIKHKSGVRITIQFLFDRIMLALGNG